MVTIKKICNDFIEEEENTCIISFDESSKYSLFYYFCYPCQSNCMIYTSEVFYDLDYYLDQKYQRIPNCRLYFGIMSEDEELSCILCDDNYNLANGCELMTNKIENCRSYRYFKCQLCEVGYYLYREKCYKLPSKVENCEIYEQFENLEV